MQVYVHIDTNVNLLVKYAAPTLHPFSDYWFVICAQNSHFAVSKRGGDSLVAWVLRRAITHSLITKVRGTNLPGTFRSILPTFRRVPQPLPRPSRRIPSRFPSNQHAPRGARTSGVRQILGGTRPRHQNALQLLWQRGGGGVGGCFVAFRV